MYLFKLAVVALRKSKEVIFFIGFKEANILSTLKPIQPMLDIKVTQSANISKLKVVNRCVNALTDIEKLNDRKKVKKLNVTWCYRC